MKGLPRRAVIVALLSSGTAWAVLLAALPVPLWTALACAAVGGTAAALAIALSRGMRVWMWIAPAAALGMVGTGYLVLALVELAEGRYPPAGLTALGSAVCWNAAVFIARKVLARWRRSRRQELTSQRASLLDSSQANEVDWP